MSGSRVYGIKKMSEPTLLDRGTRKDAMVGITWGFMQNAHGEFVLRMEGPTGQVAEIPAYPSLEAQALDVL